ncbi:hypothetical protein, partial [uncultured Gammaproteobacteria bacterium]
MQRSHKEMFDDVWNWAGKIRTVELNFGVKAYLVSTELRKLVDDLNFWHKNKNFDVVEIAARLHHRAVVIHPFINGNGRWSRMLANIYLKQNSLTPTKWNEDLLAKENVHRGDYIRALKQADNGDYAPLISQPLKTQFKITKPYLITSFCILQHKPMMLYKKI